MEEDLGNFNIMEDIEAIAEPLEPEEEEYFVNSIKDLKKYVALSKNKNTTRKVNHSGSLFLEFLKKQNLQHDNLIAVYSPAELSTLIGNWIISLKKKDDSDYEPDSLTSYFRGLGRYLEELGYSKNIVKDSEFETARQVLAAKRKCLKSKGLGNLKNRSEALTVEDEDLMWESGALGISDPETLQNTAWFVLAKHLGFRGCQESRQLCFGDLVVKHTNDNRKYMEWTEKATKTRDGNSSSRPFNPKIFENVDKPERCPVKIIEEFLRRRPTIMCEADKPFFLAVNYSANGVEGRQWYKAQALGVNSLGKFMRNITAKAGISSSDRKLTNHSIRKTCCSRLLEAGVPPTAVMQISGHKNVASLNHYASLNLKQQEAIGDILSGKDTNICNVPGQRRITERSNMPPPLAVRESSTATVSRCNDNNMVVAAGNSKPERGENASIPVFNIHNTGSGSVQIIYGTSSVANNENEISNSQQIIQEKRGEKRRRILPLNLSDSDSE